MANWLLGKVVLPEQVLAQGAVGFEGERIVYAGPAAGAPRNPKDPIENVNGWITPGLIDLHLHGAGGYDLMDDRPEAIEQVGKTLAQHGTTSYLATSMVRRQISANRHLEIAAERTGRSNGGAEVLGIHIEGPFVHPHRGGLIRPDRIWPPDANDMKAILKVSKGKLKMMTMAPELPGGMDLLPILQDSGGVGSLGHTEASFKEARSGFAGGIKHVTHLYNAMRGLHHREPGALGAVLMDHAVTAQIIADGVHVHPDLLRWTVGVLSTKGLVLITDALPASGLPDGVYQYDGRSYHSVDGSAWYKDGPEPQLFGTTLLMDEVIRRAMKLMGVTFEEAIRMASLNPARTLGIEKERGSLEAGRLADIVLWDEEFRVKKTMIRGTTVHPEQTVHPSTSSG